jgi:hypothetical protein
MKSILTILTESSVAMAMFYAIFWFFLRKETFFRLNRFFLISALFLSVMLPLFPVSYTVWTDGSGSSGIGNSLQSIGVADGSNSGSTSVNLFFKILVSIYISGAFIVFMRLVLQTGSIARTIRNSEITRNENLTIVKNNRYDLPFSFFNMVFYNPVLQRQEDLPGILAHEKVHIREQHWVDLVIAELWSVFFWFNPFVWLFERSIKQNHEFLADEGVLAQGHPVGRYQALLINQLMGVPVAGFTNHLSFAFNATRFKMMTKNRKQKKRVFRLAWAIPAIALLLVAFAEPDLKNRSALNEGKDSPAVSPQKIPVIKVSGVIVSQDGEPLPGTSVILGGTTIGTLTKADGSFELLIPENQSSILVFSFVGYVTKVIKIEPSDKDIQLKTNKMIESVVQIGVKYDDKKVPPPPPPPSGQKVVKGVEIQVEGTENTMAPPPPPPPPPPGTTGTHKGQKIVEESEGRSEEVFIVVEEMPEYPGGMEVLQKYVQEMTQKMAQEKNLKGKAKVVFTVDKEGKVTDITVKEMDNDLVGKAAVVIVSSFKQWKPGSQRGKTVPVKYLLPLEF